MTWALCRGVAFSRGHHLYWFTAKWPLFS